MFLNPESKTTQRTKVKNLVKALESSRTYNIEAM